MLVLHSHLLLGCGSDSVIVFVPPGIGKRECIRRRRERAGERKL
jgi:hypothetical protein